ncbi:hypothetical protein PHYBLDRAFT_73572 [Phycomyces blakesleeanus NRRL 1555(-)]|uniref:Uncharacterized protein n=1 Tax=Phycomyces blakesleeanus (strain ATCC 8743b / DSM 1359 / FGSC 10004 / NBRC 33097 / NRRL 1555) TaxID=763407 RepID=A0A162Y3V0_PHYB8|nr:hypothetical protein PHYBLDRAFT_73572 [Phycomyces blakesleeanus NRRL 1555(-)]OAD78145.1 hypothetical protein PHYBLDRAFT_73572 [Phycomyces blakesleeanus NRRL 1555(-)]|eukprot:XP_018296185.1 hypothetical protein PHYBLDRAFT_73572 [Phycomyces blakesleeanus NRRL 1555(-)]
MPTSNNSLEFVMDKHCEMVSHSGSADQTQFSGIAFDPLCDFNQEIVDKMHGEVVLRSVTDVFVNHANMEWTCTLAGNPAVTNLLSLKSFLPTEVNTGELDFYTYAIVWEILSDRIIKFWNLAFIDSVRNMLCYLDVRFF